MSKPFEPIVTADIKWYQNLPFSLQFNDLYYSASNGINQSRHVYIDGNNLLERWSSLSKNSAISFNIGEAGFGTGLNFLLTWSLWLQHAPSSASLHYIACEKHPLKRDSLIQSLNNWPELSTQISEFIDQYPVLTPGTHHLIFAQGRVKLTLLLGDAARCFEQLTLCGDSLLESNLRGQYIDAWYLDGFSPKVNEDMWSKELIQIMALLSKEGTTLATYSAAAVVKSTLAECGFSITKKKGFAPKRHMLSAIFLTTSAYRLKQRKTPWHVAEASENKDKTAIIIGAGLAGCFMAHSLAMRGWTVTVIEENDRIAACGSGNEQAVLFPKISGYQSPFTEFMLMAFLYAHQLYQKILKHLPIGELNGSLALAYNSKEQKSQQESAQWLEVYPELGQLLCVKEASDLAGIELAHGGLFIPCSGWMNSPALCHYLIDHPRISLITSTKADELVFDGTHWRVGKYVASVVILAASHRLNEFEQTKHLPIKLIYGQMTQIRATQESCFLKIPVCAQGHVLPQRNGMHYLGATYNLGISNAQTTDEDNAVNKEKAQLIAPRTNWSNEVTGQWAGVRVATPDYLPLLGPIANEKEFLTRYTGLHSNSKRWIAKPGAYYPGLYVCAGFGSRGLTTIPLSVEWLAASINNEISAAPSHLIQAVSPARFIRRDIIRGLHL